MPTTTSLTTTYAGELAGEIVAKALLSNVSTQYVTMKPNVPYKSVVRKIDDTVTFAAGTWWGAFNAVTYYYDHVAGTDQDKRLTSAWFGSAATRKRQALDLAVEFAEAA